MTKKEPEIEPVTDDDVYKYIIAGLDLGRKPLGQEKIFRLALCELVKAGKADFLFLREPDALAYWNSWVSVVKKKLDSVKEEERKYRQQLAVYDTLSQEQRELLKIRKPKRPKFVLED